MHGGKREKAGRKRGSRNKATADIKALAQEYGASALETLQQIMEGKDHPSAARVSAAKELLDRGYGKSPQSVALSGSLALSHSTRELTDDELAHIAAGGS